MTLRLCMRRRFKHGGLVAAGSGAEGDVQSIPTVYRHHCEREYCKLVLVELRRTRCQMSEVRSQKREFGSQKSEGRVPLSDVPGKTAINARPQAGIVAGQVSSATL